MKVSYSVRSHMGNVRAHNEDNIYCNGAILTPETRDVPYKLTGATGAPCLFAVCDGMGGQRDGEFAAYTAVSEISVLERKIKKALPEEINELVQNYAFIVNGKICVKMREKSISIGTTLALVIITNDSIKPYNIGDSRIYDLSEDKLRQISEEHTLTAQKVKMGVLTAEQAVHDKDRHTLTRHLGVFEDEMVIEAATLPPLPLTERRRLLICSDGLTEMVPDKRIEEILRESSNADSVELLKNEALSNGGKDNITCIVIDIEPWEESKKYKTTVALILAVGIFAFIAICAYFFKNNDICDVLNNIFTASPE